MCVGGRGYFGVLSDFVSLFMSQASLQASGSATAEVAGLRSVVASQQARYILALYINMYVHTRMHIHI